MGAPIDPLAGFRLDGRVALVTGASSGLGERFARVLDAAGARVVVAARRRERLEALAAELDDAVAVPCDVTDADQREHLVATALARCGRLDVLVNNAGTARVLPSERERPERFAALLDLDLVAAFAIARLAGAAMLERGHGSIVNVASMSGVVAMGAAMPAAAYSAAKGGLIALTRQLGVEWAGRGVRVNALAPGFFRSELTGGVLAEGSEALAWIRGRTPMGRPGDVGELDGALLLLAGDAGSYITGQTLCVDGGWTAA